MIDWLLVFNPLSYCCGHSLSVEVAWVQGENLWLTFVRKTDKPSQLQCIKIGIKRTLNVQFLVTTLALICYFFFLHKEWFYFLKFSKGHLRNEQFNIWNLKTCKTNPISKIFWSMSNWAVNVYSNFQFTKCASRLNFVNLWNSSKAIAQKIQYTFL